MKYIFILLLFLSVINHSNAEPVSTGSIYFLSKNEISSLSQKANQGDSDSAFRLHKYYSLSIHDDKKSIYWLKISGKNGNKVAIYDISYYYAYRCNFKAAKYWANKFSDADAENHTKTMAMIKDFSRQCK